MGGYCYDLYLGVIRSTSGANAVIVIFSCRCHPPPVIMTHLLLQVRSSRSAHFPSHSITFLSSLPCIPYRTYPHPSDPCPPISSNPVRLSCLPLTPPLSIKSSCIHYVLYLINRLSSPLFSVPVFESGTLVFIVTSEFLRDFGRTR
jgi:hypothetical protein